MNELLIEHFEEIIEIDGYNNAAMTIMFHYDEYREMIEQAIIDGYLYKLENELSFKLTEQGKDFMRMIML